MAITDGRRVYQAIVEKGGHGWDDLHGNPDNDSYAALETFLAATFAPPRGTRALELGCGGGQATLLPARPSAATRRQFGARSANSSTIGLHQCRSASRATGSP